MRPRIAFIAAAAVAAVVLFLVLRPTDEDAGGATTATRTEQPGRAARRPRPMLLVPIVVRDSRPVGGIRRATARRGWRVRIIVRADVADVVHLHGYDIVRDVAPGRPAVIAFRASVPGRFEAELEDRGLPILDLRVEP